jgi:chromosome segregation ATPase
MSTQAHVSSIEALETFRSQLVVYLSKARPALEEAQAEATQTRAWLEQDRRQFWENELRRRQRRLEEARQELFSARLSSLHGPASALQMAVHRAEQAVREAEEKVTRVRRWGRDFGNHADPLVKQLDQLHHFLVADLGKAVTELGQAITALQAYAAVAPRPVPAAAEEVAKT